MSVDQECEGTLTGRIKSSGRIEGIPGKLQKLDAVKYRIDINSGFK